jgi:Protein of unknown function (DUF3105)
LARKARTPAPPRRPVQAPQRRVDTRAQAESRRSLLILVGVAAAGLALLGGTLLLLAFTGGPDTEGLEERMESAGYTYVTAKSEGNQHVRDGQTVKYKTFPPMSGNHYDTPAVWNAYDQPLEQERLVHNLEHGGIVIQYGDEVPQSTVDELREFYLDDPNGLILAPLPRLNDKIVLTAWRHKATGTEFDEGAFERFRDAFRAKGPEARQIGDLRPGIAS